MPAHLTLLQYANSAIRHVKFSCPIGATTNVVDMERTHSDKNSIPWAHVMVSTSRKKHEIVIQQWKRDTNSAFDVAAEWVEKILRLTPQGNLIEELKLIAHLERLRQQVYSLQNSLIYQYHLVAELAEKMKSGNCGEQAALAFVYLLKHNILPLDFCRVKNGDHGFVVIGRSKESNPNDIATWGNAVICDPLNNQAFVAKDATPDQIKILLGNKEGACPHVECRQETVVYRNAKGEKTETPNIPLSLKDVYRKLIEVTREFKKPIYQPIIEDLSVEYKVLDGAEKLIQLLFLSGISEKELKSLSDKPSQEKTLFFQKILKPRILDREIQKQIQSFSFRK